MYYLTTAIIISPSFFSITSNLQHKTTLLYIFLFIYVQ